MNTTFGVKGISVYVSGDTIEVAHRACNGEGKSNIKWTNGLAPLLPDDTPVKALDNSPQGIHNIGDIKKHIEKKRPRLIQIEGKPIAEKKIKAALELFDIINKSSSFTIEGK